MKSSSNALLSAHARRLTSLSVDSEWKERNSKNDGRSWKIKQKHISTSQRSHNIQRMPMRWFFDNKNNLFICSLYNRSVCDMHFLQRLTTSTDAYTNTSRFSLAIFFYSHSFNLWLLSLWFYFLAFNPFYFKWKWSRNGELVWLKEIRYGLCKLIKIGTILSIVRDF